MVEHPAAAKYGIMHKDMISEMGTPPFFGYIETTCLGDMYEGFAGEILYG